MLPLSRNQRLAARETARQLYVDRTFFCTAAARHEIADALRPRLRKTNAFRSVLSSLLIGLAVRLAIELIKYWINQQLNAQDIDRGEFAQGEPGAL